MLARFGETFPRRKQLFLNGTADFNDVAVVFLQRLSRGTFRSTFSTLNAQKDASVPQHETATDAVFKSQKIIARKSVSRPPCDFTARMQPSTPRNSNKLRDFNCHKYFLMALRKFQHETIRPTGDELVNNPRVPPNLLNCCSLPPKTRRNATRLDLFD